MQAPAPLAFLEHPHRLPWAPLTGKNGLPKLLKPGSTAFVTFSLLEATDESDVDSEGLSKIRGPLLADPVCAKIVEDALVFFHGNRYLLHAWCVMPDHVDVLLTPRLDRPLNSIVASWKSFTTRQVNQRLHRDGQVFKTGQVDHVVDRPEHGESFVTYIESNPVEAGLCAHPTDWHFSSARRRKPNR